MAKSGRLFPSLKERFAIKNNIVCQEKNAKKIRISVPLWPPSLSRIMSGQNLISIDVTMRGVCDKFMRAIFTPPHGAPKNLPNDCS
jgi:hypothetical protein